MQLYSKILSVEKHNELTCMTDDHWSLGQSVAILLNGWSGDQNDSGVWNKFISAKTSTREVGAVERSILLLNIHLVGRIIKRKVVKK